MKKQSKHSIETDYQMNRRDFVKSIGIGTVAVSGLVLGVPSISPAATPEDITTNISDFMKVPKGKNAIPGIFPGKVVHSIDKRSLVEDKLDPKVIAEMIEKGITALTKKNLKESFKLFFTKSDIVGVKVNPVGPPLINTHVEVVEPVIKWLVDNGLPKKNIIIWDRFDYMLKDAGYTKERFPGIALEGLQTMDENGNTWRDANGNHVSLNNFDKEVYYYAKGVEGKSVRGYKDDENYLNQHVYNNEYSYFGTLLTKRLRKIINIAAFKNTGNGISMATKNLGYGAICNTGRLHTPLFFKVCTEVLAAPVIRDKLVLNITDGIRGQYDGGPDVNAQFVYPNHSLYFATDPFALDMICHQQIVEKRKAMGVKVNENPKFTDYLHYAEKLGLGIADTSKINYIKLEA